MSTDQVDYLDATIKQEAMERHCELYVKKDAMLGQAGRRGAPHIETELSAQCKYGVIHSQMPPFQQATPSCTTVLQGHRAAPDQPHPTWLQSGQAMGQGEAVLRTVCATATLRHGPL